MFVTEIVFVYASAYTLSRVPLIMGVNLPAIIGLAEAALECRSEREPNMPVGARRMGIKK
jgi:hypothetical protein